MSLTLSFQSALEVIRTLRIEGLSIHEMDTVPLSRPQPWVGKRWTMRDFDDEFWRWRCPSPREPVHVLAPGNVGRVRSSLIRLHTCWRELPPRSIIWLDRYSSVVCPELLFLQMAEEMSLPELVMLGYELCGHFSRFPENPYDVKDQVPATTSVENIRAYVSNFKKGHGVAKVREALDYVCDHAISVPEAVLATMYSLPVSESGYGMGPLVLNERVKIEKPDLWVESQSRYPDIMFSIAPIGINYDGSGHLDLPGLVAIAQKAALAKGESRNEMQLALQRKMNEVRAKVVDDNMRNRQLMSQGRIVIPVTKEDLYGYGHLDGLTRHILRCARLLYGADVREYEKMLDDTLIQRDRQVLLDSLLAAARL